MVKTGPELEQRLNDDVWNVTELDISPVKVMATLPNCKYYESSEENKREEMSTTLKMMVHWFPVNG